MIKPSNYVDFHFHHQETYQTSKKSYDKNFYLICFYLNASGVTKSKLSLRAPLQANESERLRCWGKEYDFIPKAG